MRGNELWGCWWWSRRNFISALHCRRAFPFKWIKNNRTGKAWMSSTVWIHFKSAWVLKFETVNRSWVTIIQYKTWCDRRGIKWRSDFPVTTVRLSQDITHRISWEFWTNRERSGPEALLKIKHASRVWRLPLSLIYSPNFGVPAAAAWSPSGLVMPSNTSLLVIKCYMT